MRKGKLFKNYPSTKDDPDVYVMGGGGGLFLEWVEILRISVQSVFLLYVL